MKFYSHHIFNPSTPPKEVSPFSSFPDQMYMKFGGGTQKVEGRIDATGNKSVKLKRQKFDNLALCYPMRWWKLGSTIRMGNVPGQKWIFCTSMNDFSFFFFPQSLSLFLWCWDWQMSITLLALTFAIKQHDKIFPDSSFSCSMHISFGDSWILLLIY